MANIVTPSYGVGTLLEHFETQRGVGPRSIAVVGSSGTLLYRGYGRYIDEHDVVVRVNGAVTQGYENDCGRDRKQIVVGFRTGLDEARHSGLLCCGAFAVVTAPAGGKEAEVKDASDELHRLHYPSVAVSTPFMKGVHASLNWAEHWPSTGFHAIAVAVAVAQHYGARVSVFGFGKCVPCNKYFDCDGSS